MRWAPRPKPRVLLLGVPTPRKITPRGASPCRRCRWHLEFWSGARNEGCPRRTGRVLTESRILPCRSRTELAIPLPSSRTCFAPSRSTLAARCPEGRTPALIPVRSTGQDASGGGAGYRPRVLKRYYEPVINLARTLLQNRCRGLQGGAHFLRSGSGGLTRRFRFGTAGRGAGERAAHRSAAALSNGVAYRLGSPLVRLDAPPPLSGRLSGQGSIHDPAPLLSLPLRQLAAQRH